jgi:hypothetical protein
MASRPLAPTPLSAAGPSAGQAQWGTLASTDGHPLDADQLFAALDGRSIVTPRGVWVVEIQSIFDDADYRWVQLSLAGHPPYALTFRVNPGDDADEAIRALSFWLIGIDGQQVM